MPTQETTKAARNDQIRKSAPLMHKDDRFMITRALTAMGQSAVLEALKQTAAQTDFEPGNDPYGEHDFGAFTLSTGDKCFWKIDDYNGHDGIRCVLTIMLASDY